MLVCNISLRPKRSAIVADVAEAAAALDASTTGFVVFATLVDDPASVGDVVDAYLGEIMVEAASASDVPDAGLALTAGIIEAAAADAALDGTKSTGVARSAMLPGMFINSDGTPRSANANGTMINL
jgi:hypothetical protein